MSSFGLAVMVLVLTIAILAQPQSTDKHLTLGAEIKAQRYCEVDDEIASLLVRFRMRLTNTGGPNVVVDQHIYPLVLVSRTLKDVKNNNHEFELHAPDIFSPSTSQEPSSKRSDRDQHVIRDGETFEADSMETTLPIPRTAKYSPLEALAPGTHYVQIAVSAVVEGTTNFVRTTSPPFRITVENNPRIEKCR